MQIPGRNGNYEQNDVMSPVEMGAAAGAAS